MSEVLWGAILVSVVAPLLTIVITSWVRSREKKQDWARADALAKVQSDALEVVAAQAREAARLLVVNNELVAESARAAAAAAAQANKKLDVVHGLVNSGLTESKLATFNATQWGLVLLRRLIAGDPHPASDDLALVIQTEKNLTEMRADLADREVRARAPP